MTLKFLTFNLRYDKPDPGSRAWTARRPLVAALIARHEPHAFATQEGLAHQVLDLHRLLPAYQSVGGCRCGTGLSESCAVFFKKEEYDCLQTGDFYLSETPRLPGSVTPHWGNRLPRMATWACLTRRGDGRQVLVCNTHFDHESAAARHRSAELIRAQMADLGQQFPAAMLIVSGDFNAEPEDACRQALLGPLGNELGLRDALAALPRAEQPTFHDFTGTAFRASDTIYHDSRAGLLHVAIDRAGVGGIWPSDHYPVLAAFDW
jgi:endonuclease/exonuclease/phosphatase family metal-dependent hydrolase